MQKSAELILIIQDYQEMITEIEELINQTDKSEVLLKVRETIHKYTGDNNG